MSITKRLVGFVWALLWVAALAGVAYYFYYQKLPCKQPIRYSVGTLDARFGVSQAQFEADITQAAALWSDSAGKPLFVYDPNAATGGKDGLPINLVYDERQQTSQEEASRKAAIHETTQSAAQIKAQYTSLQQDYKAQEAQYNQLLAQYNQASNRDKERNSSARVALEAKRQEVNQLADHINALIAQYNGLVRQINANVHAINTDGLTGTQFEEGVYISDSAGQRINIYQFDNKVAFIRVLAHELGHALGLAHNDNIDSIMSPVNQSKSLTLSAEDVQELQAECGI